METSLRLKYSGPAVDSGAMDVYQVSANMIAFSDFMVVAAKISFGEQIEARAEVAGFGRGSFITHLIFNFAGEAATIFAALTVDQLLTIVNEAFEIWKHLKGEPPKSVEQVNSQAVKVTNNNGQIIQVQTQSLNLVFNEKASEAVKQFVREQLAKDGIDSIEIETEKKDVIATATQSDAYSFQPVRPIEAITDTTIQMTLIVEAPVFKDGNKWRLSDGQSSFFADIVDIDFLSRVDSGELFGKGDLMRVDLRITQERAGIKISTERTVLKVHEHRRGQEQYKLV